MIFSVETSQRGRFRYAVRDMMGLKVIIGGIAFVTEGAFRRGVSKIPSFRPGGKTCPLFKRQMERPLVPGPVISCFEGIRTESTLINPGAFVLGCPIAYAVLWSGAFIL